MSTLIAQLEALPEPLRYALPPAGVLAESVLLVGLSVPTFTLLLTAGALARQVCCTCGWW